MFDTDMGVDDAIALTLALCASRLEVVGVATVGGNVSVDRATHNAGRCLGGLRPAKVPAVGRGLDQTDGSLPDATHVFGEDGLGNSDLPIPDRWWSDNAPTLYERILARYSGELLVLAIGPLTNLAALLETRPLLLAGVQRLIIMGGAIFCPGNVTPKAEFNIYRDPDAAAKLLASGLPITLVPLDVTRKVVLDESHRAHLATSNTRSGQMLAKMMEYPMGRGIDAPPGRFLVHDAVAVGVLLWPELFLKTQMAVKVVTQGPERGRTVPAVGKKDVPPISVILSVQAADFVENMLELLCSEAFVV
jgi:purine nucleosidase